MTNLCEWMVKYGEGALVKAKQKKNAEGHKRHDRPRYIEELNRSFLLINIEG